MSGTLKWMKVISFLNLQTMKFDQAHHVIVALRDLQDAFHYFIVGMFLFFHRILRDGKTLLE